MSGILIGSIAFVGLFIVSAYIISDQVTKDVSDDNLKSEYRRY